MKLFYLSWRLKKIRLERDSTDISETGGYFFFNIAKSSKNHGFRSRFQKSVKIVLVDEFHRNRCQNEDKGVNFQEKH